MTNLGGKVMSEDTDKDVTGTVDTIIAGTNIDNIDSSDPANPIINASAGGASPLTTKGDVFTYDTGDQRLAVGTDAFVLTADSAEPTGLKWVAAAAVDPLTTKGDVFTFDTDAQRLAVGTNGQLLSADSAEATGLKWIPAPSGTSTRTTKGDLEGFSTVDARIPVGTNDQVLTADSAEALGVKWATPAAGGSGGGSVYDLSPGTGFGMTGVSTAAIGSMGTITISANRAHIDLIYFDGVTTVTELNIWSVTAPGIRTLHVALHAATDRGTIGSQEHVDTIVTTNTALTLQSKVPSVAWTPTKGWKYLISWTDTSIPGVMANAMSTHGGTAGIAKSMYIHTNAAFDTSEFGVFFLVDDNYDTAPNTRTAAADLNDDSTGYAFTGVNGNVSLTSTPAVIILKAG